MRLREVFGSLTKVWSSTDCVSGCMEVTQCLPK